MTRSIKVSGARFSKSALPRVINHSEVIEKLAGLVDWFTASPAFVEMDGQGGVKSWQPRVGGGLFEPVVQDGTRNPKLIQSPEGYPALHFEGPDDNQTPMKWSGTINAPTFTKVVIAKLEDASGYGQILSFGVSDEDGRQMFQWESPKISSKIDLLSEGGNASINALETALKPAIYASAFDQTAQLNSVMSNGDVVTIDTPSGTAEVTLKDLILSGSVNNSVGSNQTPMTVYDVLIFDTDILSSADSTARDALMNYARAKLGI